MRVHFTILLLHALVDAFFLPRIRRYNILRRNFRRGRRQCAHLPRTPPPQQPPRMPCADRSFIIPYYYGTAARTRTPALLSVFTSQMLISCTAQPDLQALNASMTLAYVLTSAFSAHYLLTLFSHGQNRATHGLAPDPQPARCRRCSEEPYAPQWYGKRPQREARYARSCVFSTLDGETLTLLFVFLYLVPGPNQRHRYSCVPHSSVGDLYFVLQFLAHNHDLAYSVAILFLGLVLGHWGHCNFRLYHAHVE